MKKILLIFLTFVSVSFAQLPFGITETFSEPPGKITSNTKGYYLFDTTYVYQVLNSTMLNDLSSGNNDLTIHGWANETVMADSAFGTSPFYSGGKIVRFHPTFYLTSSSTDFNPAQASFTISFWANFINATDGPSILNKGTGSVTGQYRIRLISNTTYLYLQDSDAPVQNPAVLYLSWNFNTWYRYNLVFNKGGNVITYINSLNAGEDDISGWNTNISPTELLHINAYNGGTAGANMYLASLRYDAAAMTLKEVKESYFLDPDWYSKQAVVLSAYEKGSQSIKTDTVYTSVSDSTLPGGYQWALSWQDSIAGGTWTNRSYNFTEDFSGDSLYFGINGTNLIVYTDDTAIATISRAATTFIDNILLTTSAIPATDQHGYKKAQGYNKKWGGYR